MEITRSVRRPDAKAPEDWFTGTVHLRPLLQPHCDSTTGAAVVTFDPGARTAWHTHPLGQTLVVMEGEGWAQVENGPKEEIHRGDIVWFPPGEKHWHGATATSPMVHIAIQEKLDGDMVFWMEKVTEEQYNS